jgi:hypothetical protein
MFSFLRRGAGATTASAAALAPVAARRARSMAALLGLATVAVTVLLGGGARAQAGAPSAQPSVNVGVIPGFRAPRYPGFIGVPAFPAGASGLAGYHFSQLAAGAVTPAVLQGFDTVVLYGVRWTDLPAGARSAINAFAATGKVLIWDADGTGSQDYSSFVHPFTTTASGEVEETTTPGAVVTFPAGTDPLASPNPSSPVYLDPGALTANTDLIEDMSVMTPDVPDWSPGLIAANQVIPGGGWVLAWAYGSTGSETGMTIYSGMDADVFAQSAAPNYAVDELAIELATPFQRTAAAGCAPNCAPPPTAGGGSTGGTGATGGTGSTGTAGRTFASCAFARRPPVRWVRSRVSLLLKTSVASGLTGQVLTAAGKVVASGTPTATGELRLVVNTRLLRSNRTSKLLTVVLVNSARACSLPTRLRVDNTPPKLLLAKLVANRLTLRTSEAVQLSVRAGARTLRTAHVRAGVTLTLTLPAAQQRETLVLVDRAGNRTTAHLG